MGTMADADDTLKVLEEDLDNLQKEVTKRIEPVLDQIAQVSTLEQQNTKLGEEIVVLQELLDASQESVGQLKQQFQLDKKVLEDQASDLRRKKKNLEEDVKTLRADRNRLIGLISKTIDLMDDCLLRLPDFRLEPSDSDSTGQSDPSKSLPPARGSFICCMDDFFEAQNTRRFDRLRGMAQDPQLNIDFGERPIFIRSSMEYPPIPEGIDIAIIFTPGFTHTDSETLRKSAKNAGAHVISHSSLAFVIKELKEWRKNPQFAHSKT